MRILLTNDDGIHAPGLKVLEAIARQFSDDIWIVAPAEEQSGAGHSLTLTSPVRLRQYDERRFAVAGTPTDSVTMGLRKIMPAAPDVILSGVNRGANLGDDVTYSGTVAAAIEGALAGIRSIALSQVYAKEGIGDAVPFEAATGWGAKVVAPLLDAPFAPRTLMNVNFPPCVPGAVTGVRVVPHGRRKIGDALCQRMDPRGRAYYWIGPLTEVDVVAPDTDLGVLSEGGISVTPLHLDLTHGPTVASLRQALA